MDVTVADRAAERLRRLVITGELPRGTLANESSLARQLGCGRTPLREALHRLDHEYLLKVVPRQGVMIPPLGIVDFQQAHEALLCIALPQTLELAAGRITQSQIGELNRILADAERAQSDDDFFELAELDRSLHTTIAMATGNRYVTDAISRLHGVLEPFIYAAYDATRSANSSAAEHEAIVEALRREDPDLAKRRFLEHIIDGRQRVLEVLGLGDFDSLSELRGLDRD